MCPDDEARHLRAAIKNTARAYGGMDVLASVIGVPPATLRRFTGDKGRRPASSRSASPKPWGCESKPSSGWP